MESLNLFDMSDRELLHIIEEEARPDGWTETKDVAEALGMRGKHPAQPVGIRLSWMSEERKDGFGLIERHKEHSYLWRLNRVGRALKDGDLTPEEAAVLSKLDSARVITVTQQLSSRFGRLGRGPRAMMRREWQRGTERR